MEYSAFSNLRLTNQRVTTNVQTSVQGLVAHLGAIQAQDYPMAKWALGARLKNVNEADIESAVDHAEILRTHVLRPTWHIVSASDIHWMLKLTAPHIHSNSGSRHRELGLNNKILPKIFTLLETALRDNNHLTREEIYSIFHQNKISTDDNRGAHILMCAELEGLICSGIRNGKLQSYALLDERVPNPVWLTREESLIKLAQIYFNSRGPATLRDFVWWSGLPVRDARKALEIIKIDLHELNYNEDSYYLAKSIELATVPTDSVLLLPAFDEFLIAYTNRMASISNEINKKAISSNGIFRPTVVVDGQVAGIWKRTVKNDTVFIEVSLFKKLKKIQLKWIEKEAIRIGSFLNRKLVLNYRQPD